MAIQRAKPSRQYADLLLVTSWDGTAHCRTIWTVTVTWQTILESTTTMETLARTIEAIRKVVVGFGTE